MLSNPRGSQRDHKHKSSKSSRDKKLSRLIASESDTEGDSEHELSYYIDDRVKLMKQVLKTIKPRKIKSMAPDCMKDMELQEINSMLLEELLGISNKRLKYIFEGKTLDEESSTDEDQPIDVISLDDISDDDFVVISDEDIDKHKGKHKRKKIKEEPRENSKKVKKEKPNKDRVKENDRKKEVNNRETSTSKEKEPIGEENLMSVLELLELQARARAIRSQLELENKRKQEEQQRLEEEKKSQVNQPEEDDEIIMEVVPHDVEIVITSSESENEGTAGSSKRHHHVKHNSKSSVININDNTNDSSIQKNLDLSQDNHTNILELNDHSDHTRTDKACNRLEDKSRDNKEEGEVLDKETDRKKMDVEKKIDSANSGNRTQEENSDSSSNDNLQVVMEREKRKRCHEKRRVPNDKDDSSKPESSQNFCQASPEENSRGVESIAGNTEGNENVNSDIINNDVEHTGCSTSNNEGTSFHTEKDSECSQTKTSKIDVVIQEFMKTQSPPPDNSEELKRIEQERKLKYEKRKRDKEKRLKNLKNKLQSFKQDVAVESSSNVTVLENIVVKRKNADSSGSRAKHVEDSDDLVINVDQDDVDCMVCD